MTSGQWIAFTVICLPSITALGWLFFRSWKGFLDAVLYVLTPDIISLFRGRLGRDWWAEFKFGCFLVACLLLAAGEKWLIETIWRMI